MNYLRFLLAFWLLERANAVEEIPSCFTNTTDIFTYLVEAADGSDDVQVVLCPNNVFTIGNLEDGGEFFAVEDGTMPLIAFPRVEYRCGEDGSSANNCVLQGGAIQLWSPPSQAVETLTVQGLTFEDASFVAILLQGFGDVEFVDCVVREQTNAAPVVINYAPFGPGGTTMQNVVFRQSVFADNAQRDPPALFTNGVITITSEDNSLLLEDCDFTGNVYTEDSDSGTYVIRSFGGRVDVIDSSFCDNSVLGFGLVEVFFYEGELEISGNGGSIDDNLSCPFLAISETIPELDRQVDCVSFELEDVCGEIEDLSNVPSLSPSIDLSEEPSLLPSETVLDITEHPSSYPSTLPSADPTPVPTIVPTDSPSSAPTEVVTLASESPSLHPSIVTDEPTSLPTAFESISSPPSESTTEEPTPLPTADATISSPPSESVTEAPTPTPTVYESISSPPSEFTTEVPTPLPTSLESASSPPSEIETLASEVPSLYPSSILKPTPKPTYTPPKMLAKGKGFYSSKGILSKGDSSANMMKKKRMIGKGQGSYSSKGKGMEYYSSTKSSSSSKGMVTPSSSKGKGMAYYSSTQKSSSSSKGIISSNSSKGKGYYSLGKGMWKMRMMMMMIRA